MLLFIGLIFWEFRCLKYDQDTRLIRYATLFIYVFFFGFRGFVYTDWYQYYTLFDNLPTIWDNGFAGLQNDVVMEAFETDISLGVSGIEPGFLYLTIFLKSIVPDYFVWVFLNTLFDAWMLHNFIKRYSPYYALGFLLFFVFGGLIIQINLMRNIKAMFLFLFSLKYLEERRMLPYMLINAIGLLFHSTAIVFFPLYFILHKPFPRWISWSIFGLGLLTALLRIQYLQPVLLWIADIIGGRLSVQIKLYFAVDFYSQSYGLSLGFIERIVTYVIILLNQEKLIQQNRSNTIFINAYILYFIVFFYFSEVMVVVERLSLLFVFSYWILYPALIRLVKETFNKSLLMFLMLIYCAMKLVVMNSNIFTKYDNLLFGIESFEDRNKTRYNYLDQFREVDE